jgi:SAM-dependent methyltransferase
MTNLVSQEIAALDPNKFMAVIGKRVIHPRGRASTETLLRRAAITESSRVLDVGCGVATTAIEITRRFGAHVTVVDIAPLVLERAARPAHIKKMAWLMPRMAKAVPYLGSIVVTGTMPT